MKLNMPIGTQLFRGEHFHQKTKLFSGKCSRYFTPSALPRRENPNFTRERQSSTRQVDVLCEAEHAYRDTTLSR